MRTQRRAALAGAIAVLMSAPSVMAGEWAGSRRQHAGSADAGNPESSSIRSRKRRIRPARRRKRSSGTTLSESDLKSGNVKLLAGGLPQLFADAWRQRLHMKPIRGVGGRRPAARSFPFRRRIGIRCDRIRGRRLRLQPHGHARRDLARDAQRGRRARRLTSPWLFWEICSGPVAERPWSPASPRDGSGPTTPARAAANVTAFTLRREEACGAVTTRSTCARC